MVYVHVHVGGKEQELRTRNYTKPILEAIVHLLKPVYAHLGNPEPLKMCLHGYSQNANESFHSCSCVEVLSEDSVYYTCIWEATMLTWPVFWPSLCSAMGLHILKKGFTVSLSDIR